MKSLSRFINGTKRENREALLPLAESLEEDSAMRRVSGGGVHPAMRERLRRWWAIRGGGYLFCILAKTCKNGGVSGKRKKVALVSSHGGHLTEILALRELFEEYAPFYITYEGTSSAHLSPAHRIKKFHNHPLRMFTVWAKIFGILWKERPAIIFSTGAEIAIPVFYIAKFFFRCRLIYLECSAQVATPSLTGRIVYPVTDLFLVQWEPLLAKYGPRALYRGGLI